MATPDESHIVRQTKIARELLFDVRSSLGDDYQAVADTIEGETSLFEAIEEAVSIMDECDILIVGIEKKEEQLAARKKAAQARAERIKGHIEQSLMLLELDQPLRLPSMTLSLRKVPQSVVITDEASIPASFWKKKTAPPPTLDKKALKEALAEKKAVPGAELDNGGQSLAIRRK